MTMTPHEYLSHKMSLALVFGYREISGHRSRKSNALPGIKGMKRSRHQYFLADDIVLDDWNDWTEFKIECTRRGIVAIRYKTKGFAHIQAK